MVEVVKFETPNCRPCKLVGFTLDRIKEQLEGKPVTFAVVDASIEYDRAQALGIKQAPTVIIYKDGQEVHRFVGSLYKQNDYVAVIESLLLPAPDAPASP